MKQAKLRISHASLGKASVDASATGKTPVFGEIELRRLSAAA